MPRKLPKPEEGDKRQIVTVRFAVDREKGSKKLTKAQVREAMDDAIDGFHHVHENVEYVHLDNNTAIITLEDA